MRTQRRKVNVDVSIDRSQFAAVYEGSVLSMDSLTPHQLEKMKECLSADYVHLQAPAGAGKTFVALNRLLELLYEEREARALFVARNAALCYFVVRWVCQRVRNTLQRPLPLSSSTLRGWAVARMPLQRGLRQQLGAVWNLSLIHI